MSKKFMFVRKSNRKGNLRVELNYNSRKNLDVSKSNLPRQSYSPSDCEVIALSVLEKNNYTDTCTNLHDSGSDVTLNRGNFKMVERVYEDYGVKGLDHYSETGNTRLTYYSENFTKV